jgi:hypothetical protein
VELDLLPHMQQQHLLEVLALDRVEALHLLLRLQAVLVWLFEVLGHSADLAVQGHAANAAKRSRRSRTQPNAADAACN